MSLSSRRDWCSSALMPVCRNSWALCCPASATLVLIRSWLPSGVLISSSSSASNPRSLSRRRRLAIRCRCSAGRSVSSRVSSSHSAWYRCCISSPVSSGSMSSGSSSPACRSISSPLTRSTASSTSQFRCPSVSTGCCSLVSASTRYAPSVPASYRNSVFDSEQSPQKNPDRCSRTSSSTSASSSRSVGCPTRGLENSARYVVEYSRNRVTRIASRSGPRSTTMPTTSTAGTLSSASARSSRYSRRASRSLRALSA